MVKKKAVDKVLAAFAPRGIDTYGKLSVALDRPRITAYRWAREKDKGGCGGEIPRSAKAPIEQLGKKLNVNITADMFFND